MSLFKQAMEDIVMLKKYCEADGEGGSDTKGWKADTVFQAAIVPIDSHEKETAKQKGTKCRYRVITDKQMKLGYHDVLLRVKDGKTLRVTEGLSDLETPESAALAMRTVYAEEWSLA